DLGVVAGRGDRLGHQPYLRPAGPTRGGEQQATAAGTPGDRVRQDRRRQAPARLDRLLRDRGQDAGEQVGDGQLAVAEQDGTVVDAPLGVGLVVRRFELGEALGVAAYPQVVGVVEV